MTNFEKSWGAIQSHDQPTHISKRSQVALDQLQERPKGKLTGWLADVIENAPAHAREARVDTWLPQRNALIEASMRAWIDAFFAEFKVYICEFNASSTAEHLTIVAASPKETFELPCRRDPSYEPFKFKCYQGHIVTHNCALLVRSYYECLQIFIVSSEMLLGLENNVLEVKPLVEFHPAVKDQQVHWALADVTIEGDNIPAMARELFGDFIKLTLGTIDEDDLFFSGEKQIVKPAHSSENEVVSGAIKDLQMWQTRDLYTRSLTRDIDVLSKLIRQTKLPLDLQKEAESLCLSYEELQRCWTKLVPILQSMVNGCQSNKLAEYQSEPVVTMRTLSN